MENLAKVFGSRPATSFMSWHVIGRDGVSERRIGPRREKKAQEIGSNPDGVFYIGESISIEVRSPFPGYLQLWNLGTSGRAKALNEKPLRVDGDVIFPLTTVDGPATAQYGLFEILIGIVTKVPVVIDPAAMGAARSTVSTRGGFSSVEEVKTVSLSDLPESDWAWSILETEVKQ